MSFFERAKAAANDLAAKADVAMAGSGVSVPGMGGARALRDLGVLAWLEATGRPVDPADRDRVMQTLRDLETSGRLGSLTVTPAQPYGAPPPPPGAAAREQARQDTTPPPPPGAGPAAAPPPPPPRSGGPAPSATPGGVMPARDEGSPPPLPRPDLPPQHVPGGPPAPPAAPASHPPAPEPRADQPPPPPPPPPSWAKDTPPDA